MVDQRSKGKKGAETTPETESLKLEIKRRDGARKKFGDNGWRRRIRKR
jgi:hypothetical protein